METPKITSKIGEYTFHVGDKVVTTDGVVGTITGICDCDDCRKRGFFEPFWEDGSSEQFITIHSVENGFKGFYQIGQYRFHPFEKGWIIKRTADLEKELAQLRCQLETIRRIEEEENVSKGEVNV